jgi:predicted ATPase
VLLARMVRGTGERGGRRCDGAHTWEMIVRMPLSSLSVEGYRSIRRAWLPLGRVNVVVGPNGSGKTNLYRSLGLLVEAAQGRLARSVAREGGMPSLLWAGGFRKHERHGVMVEVRFDAFTYRIEVGFPTGIQTIFKLDPEVKQETVTFAEGRPTPAPSSCRSWEERRGLSGKTAATGTMKRPRQTSSSF